MFRHVWEQHRAKLLIGAVCSVPVIVVAVVALALQSIRTRADGSAGAGGVTQVGGTSAASGFSGGAAPVRGASVSTSDAMVVLTTSEQRMLDAAPDVPAATSSKLPPISASIRQAPGEYAKAFFTELVAHSYAGVSREDVLSWLQSQQASSRYIVGGTAAQRNKLLVESASDAHWSNHSFAVMADQGDWDTMAGGGGKVRITKLICTEPQDWIDGLNDGQVLDPGMTEREVSGDMTVTWTQDRSAHREVVSVALLLLLERPPDSDEYGVIDIADTRAVTG